MPWIDTSELTLDPDFATIFVIVRRQEVVNEYGETTLVTTLLPNKVGILVPGGSNSLNRRPEFGQQLQGLSIVTRVRLSGEAKSELGSIYQPDLLLLGTEYYLVNDTNDYTRYGAGWIIANLTLFQYTQSQSE